MAMYTLLVLDVDVGCSKVARDYEWQMRRKFGRAHAPCLFYQCVPKIFQQWCLTFKLWNTCTPYICVYTLEYVVPIGGRYRDKTLYVIVNSLDTLTSRNWFKLGYFNSWRHSCSGAFHSETWTLWSYFRLLCRKNSLSCHSKAEIFLPKLSKI